MTTSTGTGLINYKIEVFSVDEERHRYLAEAIIVFLILQVLVIGTILLLCTDLDVLEVIGYDALFVAVNTIVFIEAGTLLLKSTLWYLVYALSLFTGALLIQLAGAWTAVILIICIALFHVWIWVTIARMVDILSKLTIDKSD